MRVKEEKIVEFMTAMGGLVRAIKNDACNSARLCGVVSEKELAVISFVGQNENVKISDIADNIEAPMSTITSIMDKLVEKKLINRDHSDGDRRVINVSLTSCGKIAYNNLLNNKKKVAEDILSKLNERDQVMVIKHLILLESIIDPG